MLIAEINTIARSKMVEAKGGLRLRDQLVSRPELLGALARPVAPLANLAMRNKLVRIVLERALGLHRDASMPRFSTMTFRSWARSHAPAESGGRRRRNAAAGGTKRTVAYYHGCATQEFEPEVGAARRYARKRVRNLLPAASDPGVIVANSTSCGMTLKAKYRELLQMEDADTAAVSRAVYDICELLVDMRDRGELSTALGELRARALYHPAPTAPRSRSTRSPWMSAARCSSRSRPVASTSSCATPRPAAGTSPSPPAFPYTTPSKSWTGHIAWPAGRCVIARPKAFPYRHRHGEGPGLR